MGAILLVRWAVPVAVGWDTWVGTHQALPVVPGMATRLAQWAVPAEGIPLVRWVAPGAGIRPAR